MWGGGGDKKGGGEGEEEGRKTKSKQEGVCEITRWRGGGIDMKFCNNNLLVYEYE